MPRHDDPSPLVIDAALLPALVRAVSDAAQYQQTEIARMLAAGEALDDEEEYLLQVSNLLDALGETLKACEDAGAIRGGSWPTLDAVLDGAGAPASASGDVELPVSQAWIGTLVQLAQHAAWWNEARVADADPTVADAARHRLDDVARLEPWLQREYTAYERGRDGVLPYHAYRDELRSYR